MHFPELVEIFERDTLDHRTIEGLRRLFSDHRFRFIAELITDLHELGSYVEPHMTDMKRWIQLYGIAWVVHERYAMTIKLPPRFVRLNQ